METLITIAPNKQNIGNSKTKQSQWLQNYYIINKFVKISANKNIKQLKRLQTKYKILQNNETISTITEDVFSNGEKFIEFKINAIGEILNNCPQEMKEDKNEEPFIAAANCEISRLQQINKEEFHQIEQLRNGDSVLLFMIKFGNIFSKDFHRCVKILIDAGFDTKKFDSNGRSAIDHVTLLYFQLKSNPTMREKLEKVAALLVEKGVYNEIKDNTKKTLQEMKLDDQVSYIPMDEKSKLFYLISMNKIKEFSRTNFEIDCYINADNGEHTLLQYACRKSDAMLPVVRLLLKNRADPNLVTTVDIRTPIELAALNNNFEILEELLKNDRVEINQQQFENFIQWTKRSTIKSKYFRIFLESKQLHVSLTDQSGNTALHYAVSFVFKNTIENLLKRGASLLARNDKGKTVLDVIHSKDLEKFFDSCLVPDHYALDFTDINYKMSLNFSRSLVDVHELNELHIISEIEQNQNLKHLLKHPLIHVFVILKWFRIWIYYWIALLIQAVFFGFIGLFVILDWNCLAFFLLNLTVKIMFFIINSKYITTHVFFEILLICTNFFGLFTPAVHPFLFVETAICFLLTAGYHPKLSKWSVMTQLVFKNFFKLLIFFSLIIIMFGVGFHLIFHKKMFQNIQLSVFRTLIMTTGEFNIDDVELSDFNGYMLYVIFAMCVSLVLVNFWTGVAVTDIERIEKDSEIQAMANVVVFLMLIDSLYIRDFSKFDYTCWKNLPQLVTEIKKYIFDSLKEWFLTVKNAFAQPFLFFHKDEHNRKCFVLDKCRLDFYLNRNKEQFGKNPQFPTKLDYECLNKIKLRCYKSYDT